MAASPNLFLSAVAQRTKRLRLGPLVMLLNLYHPLRAFEEICMLDQLSGGRLDLGIGRGAVPLELSFFGVSAEEAQDRYSEATEIVLKAIETNRLTNSGDLRVPQSLPTSFEQALDDGFCLVGSPSTVLEDLKRHVIEAGVTYVMCQIAFGDLPLAASLQTISFMRSTIMPTLHRPLG